MGCSGSDPIASAGTGGNGGGDSSIVGGTSTNGGASGSGGSLATGGFSNVGGTGTTGGANAIVDASAIDGAPAAGGASGSGFATGGTEATGGTTATGGSTGTGGACTAGTPLTGGTERCSNGLGDLGNGYSWEVWMDSGSNCATYYKVDAAFRADWNLGNRGDFLGRAGLFFGATQPHDQIGTISADYAFIKPGDNGFSWVAVYGWTFDPLMEYYIVEDWSGRGRPGTSYELRGTFTVDGGTYDVYYNRRTNAVSPQGINTDFDQLWSIRQEARQCGHISISAHFKEWDSLGLNVGGNLRESMLVVEALDGSGTVDFTSATVQVD